MNKKELFLRGVVEMEDVADYLEREIKRINARPTDHELWIKAIADKAIAGAE